MSYIVWIDPWIRRCGYAIIDTDNNIIDAWVIVNEKKNAESYSKYLINDMRIEDNSKKVDRRMWFSRMYDTFHELTNILDTYGDTITTIGIEQFYFTHRTQQHAEYMYGLRGALVMHAIKSWRSTYDIGPTEMKKYISWRGKAGKNHIAMIIMALYNLSEKPKLADVSDALGIAYVARALSKNNTPH